MVDIEIIGIKLMNDGGPLKGFADVKVGDWITYSWRIIQRKGEKIWVQEPQLKWRNNNGAIRYKSMLSVPKPLLFAIENTILLAWAKEVSNEEARGKR